MKLKELLAVIDDTAIISVCYTNCHGYTEYLCLETEKSHYNGRHNECEVLNVFVSDYNILDIEIELKDEC